MNAKLTKLKSNIGASLAISLLLFLVCATLGSVVLTAGTTTLRRVFSMSEMDQRYYSVTSAAELLTKEIVGKQVTIRRISEKKSNEETTVYTTYIPDIASSEENPLEIEITEQNKVLAIDSMSILTGRAVKLMFGNENCNTEEAMDASFAESIYASGDEQEVISFEINHKDKNGNAIDYLKAYGTCKMKLDGTLIITLKDESDSYTLVMTLTPKFDETTSASTSVAYPEPGAAGSAVTTEKVEKISTVEWEVSGISKRFTS